MLQPFWVRIGSMSESCMCALREGNTLTSEHMFTLGKCSFVSEFEVQQTPFAAVSCLLSNNVTFLRVSVGGDWSMDLEVYARSGVVIDSALVVDCANAEITEGVSLVSTKAQQRLGLCDTVKRLRTPVVVGDVVNPVLEVVGLQMQTISCAQCRAMILLKINHEAEVYGKLRRVVVTYDYRPIWSKDNINVPVHVNLYLRTFFKAIIEYILNPITATYKQFSRPKDADVFSRVCEGAFAKTMEGVSHAV